MEKRDSNSRQSEKGKTMEIVEKSVVTRGWGEE